METVKIIDVPKTVKDFLALPKGIYKNVMFKDYKNTFPLVSYMKDGDNEYFSSTLSYIAKYGDNYLIKNKEKSGLSFKDGKVKIWFGKNTENMPYINELFKIKNWNFIEPPFFSYITVGALTKLFKGKITNTKDLLKSYIKSVRFDCSPQYLYTAVKKRGLTRLEFYAFAKTAKNINHFCQKWAQGDVHKINLLYDIREQYEILGLKIDYNWSNKRFEHEHTKATKIIMAVEVKNMEDTIINYPDINLPYGFEILNTKKLVFQEGSEMSHCIYTNYWARILRGDYVAFHVTFNGEVATLGCTLDLRNGEMKFNQVYRKYDKPTSTEMKDYCMRFINNNNFAFKDFVLMNNGLRSFTPIENTAVVRDDVLDFVLMNNGLRSFTPIENTAVVRNDVLDFNL